VFLSRAQTAHGRMLGLGADLVEGLISVCQAVHRHACVLNLTYFSGTCVPDLMC
jgi:hypothetical protein